MGMTEPSNEHSYLLRLGDELLLSILELLSVRDILSCSLTNSRLRTVSNAAFLPFRLALKHYELQYHPYDSPLQSTPDRPLGELLESIHTLNRNWLHLNVTDKSSLRIIEPMDDIYFFNQKVIVSRYDDSDDEDMIDDLDRQWDIEVFGYGAPEAVDDGDIVEIDEDGAIVEEIDPESHGIDVNAIETDEEDSDGEAPSQSGSEDSNSDDIEILENEGIHTTGLLRVTTSTLRTNQVDITQDLIITAEKWLRSKVKKSARRPVRGGLNFARETHFLRCLSVTDLKPHPACNANLGAINVQSLCTVNKEDYEEPLDLRIQGPLVAFAVRHAQLDRIVVVNWQSPLRSITISLVKELYMDIHFLANDLLAILACPVTDADMLRRGLDDESFPIRPRGGRLKLYIYYVGPSKGTGLTSPWLLQTLLLPRFIDRLSVDLEAGKFLPQASEHSSQPAKGAPALADGLAYRHTNEAGVIGITFSGFVHKRTAASDEDNPDSGTEWIVDIVVLKSHLLKLAKTAMDQKSAGECEWDEWIGSNGEYVRVFPHSEEGWLGLPKLYEASGYRLASITPLRRGDQQIEYPYAVEAGDGTSDAKHIVQADRRMDVLDFCPARIDDVREALAAKRRRKELEDANEDPEEPNLGMFGVDRASLLDGEGSEITLVEAPSKIEGGPFVGAVESSLPYILSRFDLDRGRKADGTLPLPESIWMTETELVLQVRTGDDEEAPYLCFDRYSLI
ncbi:SubName: Full=Uncharacterized protein {ECO:0000313/EMBL:CCA70496.1} [Serendipita indica DSM 11827]|uniref:F-box domain-containing protein n=1 Tax=Serendipita indica (strain DSM 11827) TaxID=1109443 RepID=G4TGQ3_SERID|nr:SubName: Full=Uncharacterized protein {ECO:0000313/EMBL:CCA70496.1} [Serendipita indica DSM 11827]CCA70496.1 hypothetical protein PIIN_04433 [Serendipita indica DSM 11827]